MRQAMDKPNTWDPTVTGEATYTPSPGELATVEWMQRNGAPKTVFFIKAVGRGPVQYNDFLIRFVKDGKYENLESRLVQSIWGAYYALFDLDRAGILEKVA